MARVDVNTASREQLIEQVGVRPEVADEILKLREKQGRIADIEALRDVKGIGPATLEQLRSALAFGETAAKKAASEAADVAATTVRAGAETARSAADAGARVTSIGVRDSLQTAQRAMEAAGELERRTARAATDSAASFGRSFADLASEQMNENLRVAIELTRARNLGQVVEIQSRYLRETLERLMRLGSCYTEMYQKLLSPAAFVTRSRADRAA
ncbi:helix-hairpin-helix domain-containing protein [Benzoatithermus flavus]|uniref:Helix-hairpin-helix domain-containing protein n=1 Tax=Benzoatithermus flavus TaxID=3108223 RepID=A0ABU8XP87_9PROT